MTTNLSIILAIVILVVIGALFYFFTTSSATATAVLNSQNNSGQAGTATLVNNASGNAEVRLNLGGTESTVPQPAHIHVGTCDSIGEILYPLNDVVNGSSITTLNVPVPEIVKNFPLALNVHKSSAELGVYTACGNLTSK